MDNNNMNIKQTIQLLGIQDVTTKRQKKNGTREFKLPVKDQYGNEIHVASFASGYVRRTKAGGYCPSWQLNKTKKQKRYVEMTDYDTGRPVIRTFKDIVRVLIKDEQERLEYLISFCLKNYYIGQANMLSNEKLKNKIGWRYGNDDEISVTINGHKYKIK